MNAKQMILARLSETRTPPAERSQPSISTIDFDDPVQAFVDALRTAGGEAIFVEDAASLDAEIIRAFDNPANIIDTRTPTSPALEAMERCDLAIVEAAFGVAENGAVWIDPAERYPRALLTLARSLAILLPADAIVETMHDAYARLDFDELAYGLFMAGPSKTADIEQALVLGAHGAMALKLFLTPICGQPNLISPKEKQ
ncbi:LutC/YkgG family protein [Nitratifractor sp.]